MNKRRHEWAISTANQVVEADGANPFDACVAALKAHLFDRFGMIMEVKPVGEKITNDNTYYCSTERVFHAAGISILDWISHD